LDLGRGRAAELLSDRLELLIRFVFDVANTFDAMIDVESNVVLPLVP
jgi:hypothetical protein